MNTVHTPGENGHAMTGQKERKKSALADKSVFTTGDAAKICKVSQQTIIRCFDTGQLRGYRVPGSRFRRIPRDVMYKFMKDNGIPTDELEIGNGAELSGVQDETEGSVSLTVEGDITEAITEGKDPVAALRAVADVIEQSRGAHVQILIHVQLPAQQEKKEDETISMHTTGQPITTDAALETEEA